MLSTQLIILNYPQLLMLYDFLISSFGIYCIPIIIYTHRGVAEASAKTRQTSSSTLVVLPRQVWKFLCLDNFYLLYLLITMSTIF